MPSRPTPAAVLASAVLLTLIALPGCGRRGALDAPPGATASGPAQGREAPRSPTTVAARPGAIVLDSPDGEIDEADNQAAFASPSPTPRKRQRAYDVPKEPFILDALL